MENAMTPADFSALMGNRDGWGNGGAWWLIILFLFVMGGGNGWNRGGEFNQYATAASQQEILFGQQFNRMEAKMDSISNGICDATYALNNTITGEGRGLQAQLADATCKITTAIHAEGEATRGLIQTNEIQALRDKVSALEADNRMCGVVRYPMSYAYSAGPSPFCGCNCGNGNNV